MFYHNLIFVSILLLLVSIINEKTFASEWIEYPHGIAMHGTPKYNNNTHLHYSNPDAPKNGHLKIAASKGTFDTLNPFTLKGTAADGLNLAYDRLMARRWDEPFTLYPLIAETIAMPEDRSAIRISINPNAKFDDGSNITVDDIIFSFDTLKEYGRPNMRRIYKLVETVERNNPLTLTFKFGRAHDRETAMIIAMMPVLSKKYWKERNFENTLLEPPISSGPYIIEKIDTGRSITYKRNPNYWATDLFANKGHYNFEHITYEYFRDDNVALEAFNKGDLNFRREHDSTKWKDAYRQSTNIVKYEPKHKRPEKARGFIFNTRRKPFDDINVRQALSLAFDEAWIGKNIYYGEQKRIKSFFPNSALAASNDNAITSTSHRKNLRRASEFLDHAGWRIIDGKRKKNNQEMTFTLVMNAPEEEKIALNFKKHLERLGIVMNIRILDTATFQKRRQDYDYDMILHHWQNTLSPGTEQMLYWSCEAAEKKGRFNFSGVCDTEIDELATSIANTKNYEELISIAHKLDSKLISKHTLIPFFYTGYDRIAHHKDLKHTDHIPIYGSVLETWWMDDTTDKKQD